MFADAEVMEIVKLLAIVLHLGNVGFKARVVDHLDATEIADRSAVSRVAKLLGVEDRALIDAITTKTIFTQGETVVRY